MVIRARRRLWQHALCEFTEALTHILNLLLTLLWVLIHGEHPQNDILVLDIACLHQFLESLPVLGGIL